MVEMFHIYRTKLVNSLKPAELIENFGKTEESERRNPFAFPTLMVCCSCL